MTIKHQTKTFKKFFLEDGKKRTIFCNIRFDDSCNNGHERFSINGTICRGHRPELQDSDVPDRSWDKSGCIHEDIAKHFPELRHLIKWHLVSTDGPMYYIENTAYHAKEGNFDYARSCAVWPEATDEQLSRPKEELIELLEARLPNLMAEFFADMESMGFDWSGNE